MVCLLLQAHAPFSLSLSFSPPITSNLQQRRPSRKTRNKPVGPKKRMVVTRTQRLIETFSSWGIYCLWAQRRSVQHSDNYNKTTRSMSSLERGLILPL